MHHTWIRSRTEHNIHHPTQYYIRQIQISKIYVTIPRITRNILQQNTRSWCIMQIQRLEQDLVKDLFISNTNTSIQMDLLSEVRTPQQVLNFAIKRLSSQANQQEILKASTNITSWSQVSYLRNRPWRIIQQEKLNLVTNEAHHSPKIISTCSKPKISLAKYAKSWAILHRYAKHQCLNGEIQQQSDTKTEAPHDSKTIHKQDEEPTDS